MADYILPITFLCGAFVCFIALLIYVLLTGDPWEYPQGCELPAGLG